MEMPADFRYREVFLRGKPQHDRFDLFRARHPSMDVGRRAKMEDLSRIKSMEDWVSA